jgi:hypothetical protein
MSKNSFTRKDIGAVVVFAAFDGGSYSATIKDVTAKGILLRYFMGSPAPIYKCLPHADSNRLTRFGSSSFLVIEEPAFDTFRAQRCSDPLGQAVTEKLFPKS